MSDQQRTARRFRVEGHVQGVFFRATTRSRARRLGLGGWVRNAADGSVEAHVEGSPEQVAALEDWIRGGGPAAARVDAVDVEEVEPDGTDRFEVRRS